MLWQSTGEDGVSWRREALSFGPGAAGAGWDRIAPDGRPRAVAEGFVVFDVVPLRCGKAFEIGSAGDCRPIRARRWAFAQCGSLVVRVFGHEPEVR